MAYTITEAQATELLKIAEALVCKQIKKGMIPASDHDDYIQELVLIMVQHQDDWTVPEGIDFPIYAYTVMAKRLFSIWHKRHQKKDLMADAISLNITFINEDGEKEELINCLTEYGLMLNNTETNPNGIRADLIPEVRKFIATLPEKEQELCELLMHHSKAETCRILGKKRTHIWRMMKPVRNKMVAAGLDNF